DGTNVTALAGREQVLRAMEERPSQPAPLSTAKAPGASSPVQHAGTVLRHPKHATAQVRAHRAAETVEIRVGKQTQPQISLPDVDTSTTTAGAAQDLVDIAPEAQSGSPAVEGEGIAIRIEDGSQPR